MRRYDFEALLGSFCLSFSLSSSWALATSTPLNRSFLPLLFHFTFPPTLVGIGRLDSSTVITDNRTEAALKLGFTPLALNASRLDFYVNRSRAEKQLEMFLIQREKKNAQM